MEHISNGESLSSKEDTAVVGAIHGGIQARRCKDISVRKVDGNFYRFSAFSFLSRSGVDRKKLTHLSQYNCEACG